MAVKNRKALVIIIASIVAAIDAGLIVMIILLSLPKKEAPVMFLQSEYIISDGEKINAGDTSDVAYKIIGNAPEGVTLSEGGVFTISSEAPYAAQFLVGAEKNGEILSTAVCTISVPRGDCVINFENLSSFVLDGDTITATVNPSRAVSYSVKGDANGIRIDNASGVVKYNSLVADGTEFTVVAAAGGKEKEKTFIASTVPRVTTKIKKAFCEYGKSGRLNVPLDFGADTETKAAGVIGASFAGKTLSSDEWSYNADDCSFTISAPLKSAVLGENPLKIYTQKNAVSVVVNAYNYVRTAQDLANIKTIDGDNSALSKPYVLVNDIDLTEYLSDKKEGWTPIGVYHDVTDGTATHDAFSGIFDGNGFTIKGLWMDRSDDYAYNGGLFGYTTASAVIQNLRLTGSDNQLMVKSFSGSIVGVNNGEINNCAVNVNVVHSGAIKCGSFVGRNFGAIKNCYSLGSVTSGEQCGAFCGENTGELNFCYAVGSNLCGENTGKTDGSQAFFDEQDLIAKADFSAWDGWEKKSGALPTIKSIPFSTGVV